MSVGLRKQRQNNVQSFLRMESLDDRIVPSTLLVDDDKAQFPSAPYQTIQAAVDAASPGDTIRVAAGIYTEQVTVPSTKDDITIRAQQPHLAVIQAPDTMTGSKAIVQVDGAEHVTIRGFTITGPSADIDFGVQVTGGGSATIRDNIITAIRNPELSGDQTGIAVVVGGSEGATGTASIFNNVITDYQKGGIIVANAGSKATITDNRIVGSGATDVVAQNGIQVSDGASAVISDNDILANIYTGDDTEATGIIVSDAGVVVISDNKISGNQTGILAEGAAKKLIIVDNTVRGSLLDGIVLNESHGAFVGDNRVTGSGRDGIQILDTKNAVVLSNTVKDNSRDGIHVEGLSKNNIILGNKLKGNDRFDAYDDTTGSLTGGTANIWVGNSIGTKNRPGLH